MYVPPRLMFSKRWEQFSTLTRAVILGYSRDNKYDDALEKQVPLTDDERVQLCFSISRQPDSVKASSLGIFTVKEICNKEYATEQGKQRILKKLFELTKEYDTVYNKECGLCTG